MIWTVLLCILALIALLMVVGWMLFNFTCVRFAPKEAGGSWAPYKREVDAGRDWVLAHTQSIVEIISSDGLLLKGAWIPAENPKGTVIAMHGYRSRYTVDFGSQASFYNALGYNLLLPMQRSHPDSQGKYICFGVKERMDMKLWAQHVDELLSPGLDIAMAGISMGASTVMMATQLQLPPKVRCVIADCGYTSPWDIVVHVAKRNFHLPAFPMAYLANFYAKLFAKFSFTEASAKEAMRLCKLPVLFIHGAEDSFVPLWMTETDYENCAAEKEKLIVPGAAHAQSFLVDPETYKARVSAFLSRHMKSSTFFDKS